MLPEGPGQPNTHTRRRHLLHFLRDFAAEQPDVTERMRMWMHLLWGMGNMDEADYLKMPPLFRGLMDTCRIKKLNTMAKEKYRKSVLEYEDVRIAVEDNHKIGFAEGLEKGIEKGLKEGMVKGMEKGMEKGREEGRQRLFETARKLLSKCMTINEVAEITGLNLEEPHLHE